MLGRRLRFLGITPVLLLTCSAPATQQDAASAISTPTASPTAVIAMPSPSAGWTESLTFTGDVTGTATTTAPDDGLLQSECTGPSSRRSGIWAATLVLNVRGTRFALVMLVHGYTQPATLTDGVTLELHNADLSRVYVSQPGDAASFTVSADESSGRLDATLSSAADPTKKTHVTGYWTCGS